MGTPAADVYPGGDFAAYAGDNLTQPFTDPTYWYYPQLDVAFKAAFVAAADVTPPTATITGPADAEPFSVLRIALNPPTASYTCTDGPGRPAPTC